MCEECSANLVQTPSRLKRPVQCLSPELNPYRPLDTNKREIRLIEIRRDSSRYFSRQNDEPRATSLILHTVSLDAKPEYECISYCWGTSQSRDEVEIDGVPFLVSSAISTALRTFHDLQYDDLYGFRLWADAICINQEDIEEREHQITFMHNIYAEAVQVRISLAWYSDRTLEEMCDSLQAFHEVTSGSFDLDESDDANTLTTYYRLVPIIRHPYWERRWTTQELAFAGKKMIYLGPWTCRVTRASFENLQHFCWQLQTRLSVIRARSDDAWFELQLRHPYDPERTQTVFSILDESTKVEGLMTRLLTAMKFTEPGTRINTGHFAFMGGHNCAVKHDHIYALLSCLPPSLTIKPDYRTPWEIVYADFTFKIMFAFNSLWLMRWAGLGTGLASWAVDWGNCFLWDWTGYFPTHVDASLGSQVNFRAGEPGQLITSALFIDKVKRTAPGMEDKDFAGSQKQATFEVLDRWSEVYRNFVGQKDPSEFVLHPTVLKVVLRGEIMFPFLELLDQPDDTLALTDEYLKSIHRRVDYCRFDKSVLPRCIAATLKEGDFFITASGKPGHTRHGVQEGDMICIIAGAEVPFCLRPVEEKENVYEAAYRFVGPCYLEGAMHGEPLQGTIAHWKEKGLDVSLEELFQEEITLV